MHLHGPQAAEGHQAWAGYEWRPMRIGQLLFATQVETNSIYFNFRLLVSGGHEHFAGGTYPRNPGYGPVHLPRSFIILCLLVRIKSSCWQANKQTHTHTNRRHWKDPTFATTLGNKIVCQSKANHHPRMSAFSYTRMNLTLTLTLWPCVPRMKFLCQGFQKLEKDTHTVATGCITAPYSPMVIIIFRLRTIGD